MPIFKKIIKKNGMFQTSLCVGIEFGVNLLLTSKLVAGGGFEPATFGL